MSNATERCDVAFVPAALLVRPVPMGSDSKGRDESIASYLFRLALENGFLHIGSMLYELRVRGFMLSTADRGPAARRTVALLEQLTLLPRTSLESLTLCNDIAAMTGDVDDDGRPWVLNAHRLPTKSTAALHVICTVCLANDPEPYWRRHWRFATSTVCGTHHCRLIERCPSCNAQFDVTLSRRAELTTCETCGESLKELPSLRAVARRPPWLKEAPQIAKAQSFPVSISCSAQWWMGLRILLYGLCTDSVSRRIQRSSISSQYKVTLRRCREFGRRDFCLYPLELRHALLGLLSHLLGSWPTRFSLLMGEAGVTASRFSASDLFRPFWLESVLTGHLGAAAYRPSPEEVDAAAKFLQRDGGALSKLRLKRTMGVTEAAAIDIALIAPQKRLSRDELLAALMRLDHVVQNRSDARDERLSWMRDACAIGLAVWLGVSFRTVVQTTLRQGHELESELRDLLARPGDWQIAIRLVHGWLANYLMQVRPRFAGYEQDNANLLLSRFGEPYGGFGLPARFADTLRDCGLKCCPRGAGLLVGAPLRERLQIECARDSVDQSPPPTSIRLRQT